MDGLLFYWIAWFLWIIVTFLLPKTTFRTICAVWILCAIIVTNLYITIGYLEISITYLALLLGGFVYIASLERKYFHIFTAITVMVGYTSLLIWEANAPVWIFLPRILLIPFICILLISFVSKHLHHRLAIALTGISAGECLYSVLLANYSISQTVGSFKFLDTISVILFIVILIELVKVGKEYLLSLILKNKNSI
ncbi:YphA family membrane protein [Ornithinibacillus halotolerans]|uniref:Uncharacterized protein n=1 Tax=Ornithinibacillus halotolerans TaxID=1274357 RepID=A0A916RMY1_9BACI|nr:hypothetical protein [Ornithinibacillus halotolerans]GGA61190.1 hypothetical protein GCM10008025_01480 [Ornithinibacillus halotolerans]